MLSVPRPTNRFYVVCVAEFYFIRMEVPNALIKEGVLPGLGQLRESAGLQLPIRESVP